MSSKPERERERRFRLMAGVSLGAHVVALGIWGLRSTPPPPAAVDAAPREVEVQIEMLAEGGGLAEQPAATSATSSTASDSLGEAQAAVASEGASDVEDLPANPADELLTTDDESAEGVTNATPGAGAAPDRRRLSLDQLGVGQSVYLPPAATDRRGGASQKKPAIDYAARLDHGMAVSIAQDDQKKGLGPEGPVITQVLASAYRGNLPPNTNARLTVSADGDGRVLSVSVVSADGAVEEWQKLADEVFAQIANTRLRTMGKRGFRFTLRVLSRNQLPSGADPGVSVSAFGIPLKKGEGPRSTSIAILNPTNPSEILGLRGDLSDIGATARRVVRAHLESLEILGPAGAPTVRAPTP